MSQDLSSIRKALKDCGYEINTVDLNTENQELYKCLSGIIVHSKFVLRIAMAWDLMNRRKHYGALISFKKKINKADKKFKEVRDRRNKEVKEIYTRRFLRDSEKCL